MSDPRTVVVVAVCLLWSSAPATGQPLGAFRWQMLPYCNVLTLSIVQLGAVYTLDGTDDRCGAGQIASARGMAFLNPNGTIGFGVTMVQPGGTPVHLEAAIAFPSLNGTWRDSSGASGNFVLTPGAGAAGPPRLVTASGVPPGSITAIQLAASAVGAAAIAPNSITSGHLADGTVTAFDLAANSVGGGHVVDGSLRHVDLAAPPELLTAENTNSVSLQIGTPLIVSQITVDAPASGRVIVNASGAFLFANFGVLEGARCSLTTGTQVAAPYSAEVSEANVATIWYAPMGGTRVFNVAAGPTTFNLVCVGTGGNSVSVITPVLTALYVAGP